MHRPTLSGAARGGEGGSFPLWVDVQKLCNMCVLSLSWNFFVSHDKYIARPSSRATLIHRQYNRDWGTSYSRPPIDPHLTSPLLQYPGGATAYSRKMFARAILKSFRRLWTATLHTVEHSNSGKKKFRFDSILATEQMFFLDSVRFGNLINLPLVH